MIFHAIEAPRICRQNFFDHLVAQISTFHQALRELILTERIPMGKIGGGDDKIVAKLVGHIRQIVFEGTGDKDALGEPAVNLGSPACA